jgi:hypothetical protein
VLTDAEEAEAGARADIAKHKARRAHGRQLESSTARVGFVVVVAAAAVVAVVVAVATCRCYSVYTSYSVK